MPLIGIGYGNPTTRTVPLTTMVQISIKGRRKENLAPLTPEVEGIIECLFSGLQPSRKHRMGERRGETEGRLKWKGIEEGLMDRAGIELGEGEGMKGEVWERDVGGVWMVEM
ncbi:hypothetical protein Pcinc_038947 [Petrolisthes cinctipes]|uniref:Uncharacterized protein n=1 Tax=Petrolisthes cinctipes TaxID=88211 RepID=A0AAE1BQE3_PETCI|nr:hypothetical protein Pcinc_038947 [Petrolisthes cinctipes]